MKISPIGEGGFVIQLLRPELIVVNNCLNDVIELMEDGEFRVRTGATKAEVLEFLSIIGNALHSRA